MNMMSWIFPSKSKNQEKKLKMYSNTLYTS